VALIGTILGKRLRIQSETQRQRPATSEVERLLASNRKAAELLDWRPEVTLAEGLEKTIQWFQAQPDRYQRDLYYI
jgi:nucleoside-diphosphate-sugar epimerase